MFNCCNQFFITFRNFLETFENVTATTVGFTANEADEAWIREQDKLQEK